MIPSATFSFDVLGKNHKDITTNAREELKKYVNTEDSSVIDHINYEINISKHEDTYKATITARIKL
jgi:hypothetical protein